MTTPARWSTLYHSLDHASKALTDPESTPILMQGGVLLLKQVRSAHDLEQSIKIVESLWLRSQESSDARAFELLKKEQEMVILRKTEQLHQLNATIAPPIAKNDSIGENLASSKF